LARTISAETMRTSGMGHHSSARHPEPVLRVRRRPSRSTIRSSSRRRVARVAASSARSPASSARFAARRACSCGFAAPPPARCPPPVSALLHPGPRDKRLLAALPGRPASLAVKEAVTAEAIEPATAYIARPDTHLLVADTHLSLTSSELGHFSRPSVDLLFESVAAAYRDRAIGVILTGSGLDGATGIRAIKERGGTTMVQDPSEASHPSMPS